MKSEYILTKRMKYIEEQNEHFYEHIVLSSAFAMGCNSAMFDDRK